MKQEKWTMSVVAQSLSHYTWLKELMDSYKAMDCRNNNIIMWKWKKKLLSHVWLFATPWTIQSLEFSRPEYWSGECLHSQGDFPNPEIEPRSPALRADSLLAEPQGKPNNTGVGSLSLPQRIFLTQESNRGLPHCGQILYQLSHRGSLRILCA